MDKIEKALKKLNSTQRKIVERTLLLLFSGQLSKLDIKKLKGRDDIFRVRKGKIRIIYRKDKRNKIYLISLGLRSDNIYKF